MRQEKNEGQEGLQEEIRRGIKGRERGLET